MRRDRHHDRVVGVNARLCSAPFQPGMTRGEFARALVEDTLPPARDARTGGPPAPGTPITLSPDPPTPQPRNFASRR